MTLKIADISLPLQLTLCISLDFSYAISCNLNGHATSNPEKSDLYHKSHTPMYDKHVFLYQPIPQYAIVGLH